MNALIKPFVLAGLCASAGLCADDLVAIAEASVAADPPFQMVDIRRGAARTQDFVQGVPGDDFELTAVYQAKLITGERGGYDVFNAVNPGDELPGTGMVVNFEGSKVGHVADSKGDKYLLGDHATAYYLGRTEGSIDSDFANIINLELEASDIVLHGSPSDYTLVPVTGDHTGTAIFYRHNGIDDMIAFVRDESLTDLNARLFTYVDEAGAPSLTRSVSGEEQIGGPNASLYMDVSVDNQDNLYAVGISYDDLRSEYPYATGDGHLFACRYSPGASQPAWITQYGSENGRWDFIFDAAIDDSYLYTSGRVLSDLPWGGKDAFVSKMHLASGQLESIEFYDGPGVQFAGSICTDNSEFLYIGGIFKDADDPSQVDQDPYIEKRRRSDLSLVNRITFGAGNNKEPWGGIVFSPDGSGVPGNGTIYLMGWCVGDFFIDSIDGGRDCWLAAFTQDLEMKWVEQFGSRSTDWPWTVDVDSDGFVYVGGHTYADMDGTGSHKGKGDGFVTKFDPSKTSGSHIVWTRHIATNQSEDVRTVKIHDDTLYVSGCTRGSFEGFQNQGESDVYVAKLSTEGSLLGLTQFGTEQEERGFHAVNGNGVYVAGFTMGSMTGENKGYIDAYALRLTSDLDIQQATVSPGRSVLSAKSQGLLTRASPEYFSLRGQKVPVDLNSMGNEIATVPLASRPSSDKPSIMLCNPPQMRDK